MKSVGKRILVDPTPVEKITKSGIILTPKIEDKPSSGTVVSVGDEVKEIQRGDVVHFNKHVGIEVIIDEVKYLSIKEDESYVIE